MTSTSDPQRNRKIIGFIMIFFISMICCCISCCCSSVLWPSEKTTSTLPIDVETAIRLVKYEYPELINYPSSFLPPTRIESTYAPEGTYLAFIVDGSGVDYIIKARCFFVTKGQQVFSSGTYDSSDHLTKTTYISPITCE